MKERGVSTRKNIGPPLYSRFTFQVRFTQYSEQGELISA